MCLEVDVSGLGVINTILRNLAPFKKNARISRLKKTRYSNKKVCI